jgi:hypothetical protein
MKRMTCIRCYGGLSPNSDGLVKSPSVPLEAGLRFNFVVAAHLVSALHSSVFARLASESFYETIVPVTFYENINFEFFKILNFSLEERDSFWINLLLPAGTTSGKGGLL